MSRADEPGEVVFQKTRERYGCLSNFSPHPVFLGGTTWPTVEHYFQAQKLASPERRWAIQAAKSPAVAKRMGQSRAWPLRPDWEEVKVGLMRGALMAKAIQHADVRETLLGTGLATIVERSARDRFWGDPGDGSGRNTLGRLWMEVRAELTRDGPYDELRDLRPPPWVAHPGIPRTSIGWRMGAGEATICDWAPWYNGLSEAGRRAYQERFPPPPGWEGYWDDDEGA